LAPRSPLDARGFSCASCSFAAWRYHPATPEPVDLKPATPEDLAEPLAFALRYSGRKQA
jgi:hypothetical protein